MMSGSSLSFYKTMSDLPAEFDFSFKIYDLKAYYDDADLNISAENYQLSFEDDAGLWNIQKNGMILFGRLHMNNLGLLYSDKGLVSKNTILGIAIVISSSQSDRKEAESICSIDSNSGELNVNFEHVFEKGYFKNRASVNFQLYVKNPDP